MVCVCAYVDGKRAWNTAIAKVRDGSRECDSISKELSTCSLEPLIPHMHLTYVYLR